MIAPGQDSLKKIPVGHALAPLWHTYGLKPSV
jgi:hypothetical protein